MMIFEISVFISFKLFNDIHIDRDKCIIIEKKITCLEIVGTYIKLLYIFIC